MNRLRDQFPGSGLPQAILLDLDGTLVDSVPDLAMAIDAMLTDLQLAPVGESRVRDWVGNGALKLVQRALAYALGQASSLQRDPQTVDTRLLDRAHSQFLVHYQQHNGRASRLYPGVHEALQYWHRQGIKLAVVTNKPLQFVPALLERFELHGFFSVQVGGDSLAVKKPAPDPLWLACEQLRISPDQCLMIGDSRHDVEAAKAAGLAVVAVSYGYNHGEPIALSSPDLIVDSLFELCTESR